MNPTAALPSLAETGELKYRFEHCRVLNDPDARSVTTRFEDGAEADRFGGSPGTSTSSPRTARKSRPAICGHSQRLRKLAAPADVTAC